MTSQRAARTASCYAGSVLGAAVEGEDHAGSEYEKALERDLSSGFRKVVSRQEQTARVTGSLVVSPTSDANAERNKAARTAVRVVAWAGTAFVASLSGVVECRR